MPIAVRTDILLYPGFMRERYEKLQKYHDGSFFTWIHTESFGTQGSSSKCLLKR
jgi:hypothetical protein